MNYDDAIEATVTRAQAFAELRMHYAEPAEFIADVGDQETYTGAQVLDWLGY